jgi:hypothetical protein
MRKFIILLGGMVALGACGQSGDDTASDNAAANAAAAEKPRPAYCFFKDDETKGWTAKTDKDGNVVVSGKAYREDARYKALLSPATVIGTTAETAPTITANDTGFAAQDNWWDVTLTIPNSQAVTSVKVSCGDKLIATLSVPRKK